MYEQFSPFSHSNATTLIPTLTHRLVFLDLKEKKQWRIY